MNFDNTGRHHNSTTNETKTVALSERSYQSSGKSELLATIVVEEFVTDTILSNTLDVNGVLETKLVINININFRAVLR